MSNNCVRCGMNSGWLPVCPTCHQNDLIEKQTDFLRNKDTPDLHPSWGFLGVMLVIAILCFTYVYFSTFY